MVGAFTGGMVVQGALLFLVVHFGNINPSIDVNKLDIKKYEITVSTNKDVKNVNINTKDGIALFSWANTGIADSLNIPTNGKSFSMEAQKKYSFIVSGEETLNRGKI